MFTVHCPRHRARVLLGPRSIEALVDTADGVALHWRCRCGARGIQLTGRPSQSDRPLENATSAA